MKMFDNTYSYEDNQKIIYLVMDRQSKFVTFAAGDLESAMDQLKEDEQNYPGHEFTIACYPIDPEELLYLSALVYNS